MLIFFSDRYAIFFIFFCSDRDVALNYAKNRGLTYKDDGSVFIKDESEYRNLCYPGKLDECVKGYITHVSI